MEYEDKRDAEDAMKAVSTKGVKSSCVCVYILLVYLNVHLFIYFRILLLNGPRMEEKDQEIMNAFIAENKVMSFFFFLQKEKCVY